MPPRDPGPTRGTAERPRLELADIFPVHGEGYRRRHALTAAQARVMRAIEHCRTAALGGHVDVCNACGHAVPAYNSCRNRHCPKCQAGAQAAWIAQRQQRLLPTHYFHVVFTLPHELAPLARRNPTRIYTLLFVAAARTLLALGQRRLGAQLGVTAVLHTWTRALHFHPHVHCLVTGGGLAPAAARWVPTPRRYLFPVKALSRLFRGKFLAAVKRAYTEGRFDLGGHCAALTDRDRFHRLLDQLYRKEWVVYAKRPFGGADQVFRYLGRYTHRVAISNRRLLRIDDTGVCFATKHGHTVTVGPQEFIRRFLLHVLPAGFVKIRHYGLMAAGNATKLVVARRLLEGEPPAPATAPGRDAQPDAGGTPVTEGRDHLPELGAVDAARCPRCQHGRLIRYALADFVRAHGSTPPTAWDSS